MDKKKMANWRRRSMQLLSALAYNANFEGIAQGKIYTGGMKSLCVPGLHCYSCPGAVASCPLGALQNGLSTGACAYVLGVLLLFGLLLGRVICGYLCPTGLAQELLYKVPVPKVGKSRLTRWLSWVKYALLIAIFVALPMRHVLEMAPLPAFCKYICPVGTAEGAGLLLAHPANEGLFAMLGPLFTGKAMVAVALITVCMFVYRAFCRFLCPLGAFYSLFARIALLGVRVEPEKCTRCGRCLEGCRVDVRHVGDRECVQCGECVSACPVQAITWKKGRATLHPNEIS